MRFLLWCLCMSCALLGLQLALVEHSGWRWFWIVMLAFYGFAGLVMGAYALYKLSSSRAGSGAALPGIPRRPLTPPPSKEE
jgi:hypothetical protein